MLPDNLHIGPIPIHWFGIFMALAFLAAGWIAGRELARSGSDPGAGADVTLWAAAGGLIGARLWVIVESWSEFQQTPSTFILSGGGLAWYGGLAGGALAVTLFFRRHSIPWLAGADALAPAIALGQAVGRLGCQVSGDGDWGTETTLPWGMAYPHAVVGWDKPPGVRVHPTPLYEFAAYLAVFVFLLRLRRKGVATGVVFGHYLLWAGLARFAVEFVRINPRVALGLTVAQITSLVLAGVGAVLVYRARPRPAVRPA